MLRVLFVQDNAINESLALADLSAVLLEAGHDTSLLLSDEEPDLAGAIRRGRPELAIIPCPVTGHETALRLARAVRRAAPGCVIAMGGTHVTFEPELALRPEVDVACVGEAEGPMLELAEHLDRGAGFEGIRNLCYERRGLLVRNPLRPPVPELDSLPFPDRELYHRYAFIARFPWKKFATGRGCVHSCAFCWNTTLRRMYGGSGAFVRRKSPARAVEEVRRVRSRHPLRHVHFSDDLFTVHPSWLEDFAAIYPREVGLPFTCNSSVELVTPRAMKALARAGCRGVAIGVETGNERLRSEILSKPVTDADIVRAAALVHSHGMELTTFNMLGSPGETIEDAFATIELNRRIRAEHVRVNLAVPLPHTAWERHALASGELDPAYPQRRVGTLRRPEGAFASGRDRAFRNLFYIFRPAVHLPALDPLWRRLVHLPAPALLDTLRLLVPLEEKGIYGLGWVEGLRYFAHVGDPHKRTANYVALI